jgi:hypothetical protein
MCKVHVRIGKVFRAVQSHTQTIELIFSCMTSATAFVEPIYRLATVCRDRMDTGEGYIHLYPFDSQRFRGASATPVSCSKF